MMFEEILDQAVAMLQRRGRVTYRALKAQFQLDDDLLETLKDEILYSQPQVVDDGGKGLIWTGETERAPEPTPVPPTPKPTSSSAPETEREPLSYTPPHLAEKILQSKAALEGERKQVTVLFCDLANSTAIAERIGPENMHSLLNHFFELALDDVHRYEGTINQFLGDGFMALYGAPLSLEDHTRRGVLAALALRRALREADLGKPYGIECSFRMGLNSGLVVVGSIGDNLRMDYSAIGDTTNLASRLQGIAEPGEILVSESTSRLVQGYVRLEALGPVEVKGKTEPVPIYKVIATLPRRSPIASRSKRTLSQFVGRERELGILEELFSQVESGHGQIVGIVAEAGQGKSRLLYEFRQRLQDKRVTCLEGRCLSYGSSIPYHPIIDIVRNNCGITETEGPETIAEKVRYALHEVGMYPEESAPYLLQLLGVKEGTESIAVLTPEAIRTRTFETLRQMSLSGSCRQPLIIEIEDLHWIDRTSEDYLASLVESLTGASILLLTSYRPGYRPPWREKSYVTQISLRSLALQDALTVVRSTSEHTELPAHLEQTIIGKAEGNPFFLEELTRAVIEHGDSGTDMDVPETVQGVLMARIDRLPEEPKRLLQTASVLGREFSPTVLMEMWEGSGSLVPLLVELKRQGFLYERTGGEEPFYVFKHALTQDVAYESLLTSRRQILHEMAGQALETLFVDHLEDAYDRLAYHYARTDNAAKAVEYLTLVAEKAARGYAHIEAVASLKEALVHAEQLPDDERDRCILDLTIRQATSLHWSGQHQDMVTCLLRYQQRLEQHQEPVLTGTYYLWLGHAYSYLGEREQTIQSLYRALEEGTRCGDAVIMGRAHALLALNGIWAGPLQHSIAHGEQAVVLLEPTTDRFWFGLALYFLGLAYKVAGRFHRAVDVAERMQTLSVSIGAQRLQTNAAALLGWCYAEQGECEEGIQALQRALETSPDAFETAFIVGLVGFAHLERGDFTKAISLLEHAAKQSHMRSRQVQSRVTLWLSYAYLLDGKLTKAHDLALEGFSVSTDTKFGYGLGLAHRVLGQIASTNSRLTEAETHFQEALATFSSIQAQFELARTHLDLAALAHTQNNHDTATIHLSTAYAWFNKLQVPTYVERTEHRAREYGVTLTEVELEELAEGQS